MTQPNITYISKARGRLLKPYSFYLNGRKFIIPKGYDDYDGCTGGWLFLGLVGLSRFGYSNAVSLPHDWLYVNEGKVYDSEGILRRIKRKDVDLLMKERFKLLGYSKWTQLVTYRVVRFIGWFYWREL